MEEEANSWLRRAKFSHTVCHRLDTSRLASIPVSNRNAGLKTRPETSSNFVDPYSTFAPIQRNPSTNKPRYVSPTPQTKLSDSFREARSDRKRFSTPHPRGRDSEKGRIMGKLFHRDSNDAKLRSTSPLRHLSSLRFHDKGKNRRENSWSKYFDGGAGRVSALEMADEWMVDLSKLFLGLKFAHGAHSQLYHGIYKDEAVAVKIIRVPDDDENGALAARLEKQFTREVTLLSRLHHQNVIKFIAACRKPPVFCVITEYLSEGSLRSYLHKLERKSLPLEKLMTIALDIARGMEYIHSQGVLHRDLKPENILICEGFHMKIADFGIACEEAYCDLMTEDPGTYRWMAPEMIKRKLYGRKVDVYSFGLILWELVAGAIPYEDMTPIQAAFAVVNKNMRPAFPGDCHPAMRALIEQCWSLQPEKRPEFWQIVKILEQFEQSIALDGTLDLVQCPKSQDPKKGLLHRIQKLGSIHHQHTNSSPPMPKPRFM